MRSTMSPIDTPDSKFHEGNAFNGDLGTKVTAEWLNEIQDSTIFINDELISLLLSANIEPSDLERNQISEAIKKIISSNISELSKQEGSNNVGFSLEETYSENTVGYYLKSIYERPVNVGFTVISGDGSTDKSEEIATANAAGKPILFIGVSVVGAPTTITVPIIDVNYQIFTLSSLVTINNGGHVRPDWFGDVNNAVLAAIAALPATGGVVKLFNKRYKPNNTTYDTSYVSKAGVSIIGERMPSLSTNCDRLENGSIIEGRFNVFADNFQHKNVGYDLGKYVCDTYYPTYDTHTANHPLGGTWDAFAFAQPNMSVPLSPRKNFHAENTIGLLRDSYSMGHANLMEGFDGGFTDNCVGCYGVHAVVVKASHVRGGLLCGMAASTDNVIFKSDTYAIGGHIDIDTVETYTNPPNTTPWSTPAVASYGMYVNPATYSFTGPIQIGKLKSYGSSKGFWIAGTAGMSANDITVGEMILDGYTGITGDAFGLLTCIAQRVSIGQLTINTVTNAINWSYSPSDSQHQLHIGVLKVSYVTEAIVALLNAKITIDVLEVISATYAYDIASTANVKIGTAKLNTVTTKFKNSAPTIGANWSDFGSGNSTFSVDLKNYGVELKGLIKASSGATGVLANLPSYLRPAMTSRQCAAFNNGAITFAQVGIDASNGNIYFNDGASPAVGNYISLDGIFWPL